MSQPVPLPEEESADDSALVPIRTTRYQAGIPMPMVDRVIAETPVALVYNGISHAVMLATPTDLEDFAIGFSLSEGLAETARDIQDLEIVPGPQGIEIRITVAARCFHAFKATRRRLAGRTGCGLCGVESLEQAMLPVTKVPRRLSVTPAALERGRAELAGRQLLHQATGSVHAAAWVAADGEVLLVREDVGRHNALDKLLGAMASARSLEPAGFGVVTSRASHEMVQKAARAGIELLAAISAPTALAVSQAESAGLSLVGWLREKGFSIYTHTWRIAAHYPEQQSQGDTP